MSANKKFNLLNLFTRLMAALSLLNLINEFSPIEILGTLKVWLNAYVAFVDVVGLFLFGWIGIEWINVSNGESHMLVIISVLVLSFHRAQVRFETDRGESRFSATISSLFISWLWLLSYVFMALFLPDTLSFWAMGVGLFCLCHFYFRQADRWDGLPDRKIIFKELTGVAGSLAVLVLLNYTVLN